MYDETLGKIFFLWTTLAFNLTFFPQHFVGLAGMPRRIVDYNIQFTEFNVISSIGGFLFGLSHLLFLYIIIKTIKGGANAGDKAWEGAQLEHRVWNGLFHHHRRSILLPHRLILKVRKYILAVV